MCCEVSALKCCDERAVVIVQVVGDFACGNAKPLWGWWAGTISPGANTPNIDVTNYDFLTYHLAQLNHTSNHGKRLIARKPCPFLDYPSDFGHLWKFASGRLVKQSPCNLHCFLFRKPMPPVWL